jgi:hypothetical protein
MSKTLSSQIYEHIKFCTTTSCLTRKVRQKSRLMNFIYGMFNILFLFYNVIYLNNDELFFNYLDVLNVALGVR